MLTEAPACRLSGRLRSLSFEEGELAEDIDAGTRVRVTADLTVFHVPKQPQLQLQGLEGEVVDNVVNYKGTKISANLPYKVQFIRPQEGSKDLKFFSHLVRPRALPRPPAAGCRGCGLTPRALCSAQMSWRSYDARGCVDGGWCGHPCLVE